jgi:hypothetical protein
MILALIGNDDLFATVERGGNHGEIRSTNVP